MFYPVIVSRMRFFTAALAVCAVLCAACSNPASGGEGGGGGGGSAAGGASSGGTGEVRIGAGGVSAKTLVPNEAELAGMGFAVRFTGPGGTVDKEFGPQGGSVKLEAGTWKTAVKARNGGARLRGVADLFLTIQPGGNHKVDLTSCIGIRNEGELIAALTAGVSGFGHDYTHGDLVILENDITLNSPITVSAGTACTIAAEPGTVRKITRAGNAEITVPAGQNLFLGRAGETGTLMVDSGGGYFAAQSAGGNLVIAGNTARAGADKPRISGNPQDAVYRYNAAAQPLTVTASAEDSGTLSYRWYSNTSSSSQNGTLIPGAEDREYTPPTGVAGTVYYYAVVTNTVGSSTSSTSSGTGRIVVNNQVHADVPAFITQNLQTGAYSVSSGGTAAVSSVSATVTDGGVLTYQWYSNSADDNSGGTPVSSGGTAASYAPPIPAVYGNTWYYVKVTNTITDNGDGGAKFQTRSSDTVKIRAYEVTGITVSPAAPSLEAGDSETFTVTVTGNNGPIPQGVTWARSGTSNTGTTIGSSTGLLAVAANETADTVTVTATSEADTSVTGSETVTIQMKGAGGGLINGWTPVTGGTGNAN